MVITFLNIFNCSESDCYMDSTLQSMSSLIRSYASSIPNKSNLFPRDIKHSLIIIIW